MAQWLVTQGDNQFTVEGLGELEDLARGGRLKSGDMIQPPGTTEWMYVTEVPELKEILDASGAGDDDDDDNYMMKRAAGAAMAGTVAMVLVGFIVVGGIVMFFLARQLPRGDERLIGGVDGLTFSQMIVTEKGSGLAGKPEGAISTSLPKDTVLELLAKRGDWYRARGEGGEGWIPSAHVIPMYQLGGADVRDEYDPLYNPDRYVEVLNASWMQLPSETPTADEPFSNKTVFQFMMRNESRYDMADLVILATIKDAKGQELEKVEIPIEGTIPSQGRTMVGTLAGEEPPRRPPADFVEDPDRLLTNMTFNELILDDPDLQLRWSAGVEVEMQTEDFTNAEIDILELRAVPDEDAAQAVRRD